ncbi:unnamed protein product [Urochloa decumbens]|uniref:WAT1-related protein n=1 Tax=Urochloa decumbens TaxID=240449 RepID=A0ABC8WKZ5_9POAL
MNASTKAYVVVIAVQLIYTGMFVISKAAFDHGIDTYVFMFYRQAAGSLLLLPLALLRHRSYSRNSMSSWMLFKLFMFALFGITFSMNLYHVSLKFTSATVASATDNSLPAVTFFLALLLRMEHVKLKSWSGAAKLTGVALCLAGVLVIAFYAGPSMSPVNHHRAFASHASGSSGANVTRGAWVKWTFLMVLADAMWSLWIVLQAPVLKECPDKILVTAVQCFFSTVQSFVVAMVAERDFSRWKLSFDISLLAIFYAGFIVMGVGYYLQAWCVEMKGPVFLAAWTPICFIFTIFCSSFFLGEIVHLGSIVGGILLVGGLYSVLWGKSKESKIEPCKEMTKIDDSQDEQKQKHLEIKQEQGQV